MTSSPHNYHEQHAILDSFVWGGQRQFAVDVLQQYFADPDPAKPSVGLWGRHFESFAADAEYANEITTADVASLLLLSITRDLGGIMLDVQANSHQVSKLLHAIPQTPLHEVPHAVIAPDSAAWNLHALLKSMGAQNNDVAAAKLLARKRPHLLPIYDNRVKRVLSTPDMPLRHINMWDCYWTWFAANAERAEGVMELRGEVSKLERLSLLRIMDVVLWMKGGVRKV
jgi:hypothetical protein